MSALPAAKFRIISSEEDLPQSPPPGPPLSDILDRYLRLHPAIGAEAVRQYRVRAGLAARFLSESGFGDSCDEIFSLPRFCDYFKWLGNGRAAATVNGHADVVWMLWDFAASEDDPLCANPLPPAKKRPRAKEPRNDPVAFTMDQLVQLEAFCLRSPRMKRVPWWTPDHWLTFVVAFMYTGERCTALLSCPRSALQGNVLMVPAHLTKDRKELPVTLPVRIADKIRGLPQIDGSELIWPYPFGIDRLRKRYTRDVLKPAGLPTSAKHKFHALRRSAATHLFIAHGLEKASQTLRHSSSELTRRKYVSQSVVEQETGSVSFHVPAPTRQLGLF